MISYTDFDQKIIDKILNIRHHEDANTVLLADHSLNHDINLMCDYIRNLPNMEEYFNLDFSNAVDEQVYKEPGWKECCDMAEQARKVSLYFARMADLLQSCHKWYFSELEKENGKK